MKKSRCIIRAVSRVLTTRHRAQDFPTGRESMTTTATSELKAMRPTPAELEPLHQRAEAMVRSFSYVKPDGIASAKGTSFLGRGDFVRATVQIIKKNGGENNLHYHSNNDSFWMVLKGRARFYGPNDILIGEFGAM